jgi:hypothetical protein
MDFLLVSYQWLKAELWVARYLTLEPNARNDTECHCGDGDTADDPRQMRRMMMLSRRSNSVAGADAASSQQTDSGSVENEVENPPRKSDGLDGEQKKSSSRSANLPHGSILMLVVSSSR